MIYCPQCGNPNFDDANYCDTCGEPLINAEVAAQMKSRAEMERYVEEQRRAKQQQAYDRAFKKAQKEAERLAGQAASAAGSVPGALPSENNAADATQAQADVAGSTQAAGAAGAANTADAAQAASAAGAANAADATQAAGAAGAANTANASVPPAVFPVYKHGCLAQAWDDITESKDWGKTITLLGLVNMVPILNFFVSGFAMNWASQLEDDRVEPMPNRIFCDGFFLQGFYAFVMALVVGIISSLCSQILGFIPVLGGILSIAVVLFLMMYQNIAIIRIAIARTLGPGFSVKDIWYAIFSDKFGKALCATVVPSLIVGGISAFLCLSILVIFSLASLNTLISVVQMAQAGFVNWSIVSGLIVSILPIALICYFICAFLGAMQIVLTLRATSHFIMRYRNSWCALRG